MAKSVRFARRKRSSFKKRRAQIGKKSKVARVRRSRRRVKVMRGGEPKNILLIIDPQNDFTPPYHGWAGGTLRVSGAIEDYAKIINAIQENTINFSEIHVSLDTHTSMHIGHPNFWTVIDENGTVLPNIKPDPFSILSIDDDNKIKGKTIDDNPIEKYYKPTNPALKHYVNTYLQLYRGTYPKYPNRHGQFPMIWANHCFEKTEGHKIYEPLQQVLNSTKIPVKYHIKGQNNLSEMYSIFSAEFPVEDVLKVMGSDLPNIYEYVNANRAPGITTDGSSANNYDDVIKLVNTDTKLNKKFITELIGDINSPNTIYVCGEALTHCVRSSIVDLLENCEITNKKEYIKLVKNASSHITDRAEAEKAISDKGADLIEW